MVARRAHNPKVVGSNPASATNRNRVNKPFTRFFSVEKKRRVKFFWQVFDKDD